MKVSHCGNVIRFPLERCRRSGTRPADLPSHGAKIIILPCVRIERQRDDVRETARHSAVSSRES